jgi:hypothetical protein
VMTICSPASSALIRLGSLFLASAMLTSILYKYSHNGWLSQ